MSFSPLLDKYRKKSETSLLLNFEEGYPFPAGSVSVGQQLDLYSNEHKKTLLSPRE